MIEGLARRYRKAPWEVTGSRTCGAPAWMTRYGVWLEMEADRGE